MIARQLSLLLLLGWFVSAQETATKLITLSETTTDKLLEDEGESVRVKGYVETTRTNATGIHFLEFKGTDFVCVTFSRYLSAFPDGPPSETYKEKWIEVSGEIQNYRGTPQIRLESPDQVKLIEAPEALPEEPKPEPVVEEKKPEPEPEKPKPAPAKKAPEDSGLEVIDGIPAVDWRKYFPE